MPRIYRYVLPIYDLTIIAWPLCGYAPHTVNFDAIIRGGVPPYTYHWDFGDGTPPSNEAKPTHTYTESGVYTAKLTVTDSLGLTAETTIKISVAVPVAWKTISMVALNYTVITGLGDALALALAAYYNVPTDVRPAFTLTTDITYTVPTDVQTALSLTTNITYTVEGSVS